MPYLPHLSSAFLSLRVLHSGSVYCSRVRRFTFWVESVQCTFERFFKITTLVLLPNLLWFTPKCTAPPHLLFPTSPLSPSTFSSLFVFPLSCPFRFNRYFLILCPYWFHGTMTNAMDYLLDVLGFDSGEKRVSIITLFRSNFTSHKFASLHITSLLIL